MSNSSPWPHGKISIELEQNQMGWYAAGQLVKGAVHVYCGDACFPSEELKIELVKIETTEFEAVVNIGKSVGATRRSHNNFRYKVKKAFKQERYILLSHIQDHFVDGPPGAGTNNCYPFEFEIPKELPGSMLFAQDDLDLIMSIGYLLTAEIVPTRQ